MLLTPTNLLGDAPEILQKADATLPGAVTIYIRLPQTKEGVFRIGKKLPLLSSLSRPVYR